MFNKILGLMAVAGLTLSLSAQADCTCDKNKATVVAIYQAFQKGDIPTLLTYLSDDVKWEIWETGNSAQDRGVTYMKPRTGKAEVAEFFTSLSDVSFHEFTVRNIMAGGNQATGVIFLDATYKPTGKRIKDLELHVFTFNDQGKVIGFNHFLDTAKHIEAAIPATN